MTLANILTLVRLALIPFFVFCMSLDGILALFFAALIFAIASITDRLDGVIARKYNQITDLGKILDPLADKLLTFSAFVMFTASGLMHPVALLIILARELAITSIRVVVASGGKVVGAAFSGKLKTVLQLRLTALFTKVNALLSHQVQKLSFHQYLVLKKVLHQVSFLQTVKY